MCASFSSVHLSTGRCGVELARCCAWQSKVAQRTPNNLGFRVGLQLTSKSHIIIGTVLHPFNKQMSSLHWKSVLAVCQRAVQRVSSLLHIDVSAGTLAKSQRGLIIIAWAFSGRRARQQHIHARSLGQNGSISSQVW